MTKAQMQDEINEKASTIHCMNLEKTKAHSVFQQQKSQVDAQYVEIIELTKDVMHLQRQVRYLKEGSK